MAALGSQAANGHDADTLAVPSGLNSRPLRGNDMTTEERQIFNYLLRPDDNYNEAGVYWADLPLLQQVKFVAQQDAKESRRELSSIWAMFKADPLSPVAFYFRNMVLPGAGLGLEGCEIPRPPQVARGGTCR